MNIMEKAGVVGRPTWDEFFMFSAHWAGTRASCKYLKNGAVVVKDKRIRASGYNGAPDPIENCLKAECRKDREGIAFNDKGQSACIGAHAETNAMDQLARDDTKGATLYTVFFPCTPCAKSIAAKGIREVVYSQMYEEPKSLTYEIFKKAKIKVRRLDMYPQRYFRMLKEVFEK